MLWLLVSSVNFMEITLNLNEDYLDDTVIHITFYPKLPETRQPILSVMH